MLRGWVHSGFNVHRGRRALSREREDMERLAQHIIRNPFSVEKTRATEPGPASASGSIPDLSGMNKKIGRNFEVFTPCDFITAITQRIPDKSFQLLRYYGWYSNKMRGRRAKQADEKVQTEGDAVEVIDVSAHEPRRIPSKKWRELIKKVWEADPRAHGKCASFRSSTRRMSSSAYCAISGSGKRGARAFRHRPAGRNDPRSVARRPLPRLRHRTGHWRSPPPETSGSARVRLSHPLFSGPQPSRRQLFRVAGTPRNPKKPVFDFRAHFCHSAPIETHAFGFRLPANAPEDQKRFPISLSASDSRLTPRRAKSDFLSVF